MFLLLLLGGIGLGVAVSAAKGPERKAIHKEKKARRLERHGRRAPKVESLRSTANLLRKKKEDRLKRREQMGAVPLFPNGRERLVGGRADWMSDSEFDPSALRKGMKVELEHTTDLALAKEIAKDHLAEDPRYYDMLEKMERGFKRR